MHRRLALAVPALALAALFAARPLLSEEGDGGGMPETMNPGPEHKDMAARAGTFDVGAKFWMGPGQPTESKGSVSFKMILGDRFVQEDLSGDFGGMPYQGFGVHGYDRVAKKYTSYWCDNMGTMPLYMTGTSSDGGKTVEYTGDMTSPQTGKPVRIRSVVTWKNTDEGTYEMFEPHEGKEVKVLEITYTRRK